MVAEASAISARTAAGPTAHDVACTHCGLPVPSGLVRAGAPSNFCCHGCETAFGVIHSCGLDAYYRLREQFDADRSPAKLTSRRYAEFDDATFRSLYCRDGERGQVWTELFLEGVHCAACVWLVEKLPVVLPGGGVLESRLDLRRGIVRVAFDPSLVQLSQIARALSMLGYPPHPARGATARDFRRVEDRKFLVRMGVAGACAGNIMLLAFALYAGMFDGIEPAYLHLFRWASLALTTVSLVWPSSVVFRSAWAAIRTRTIHLDVPIALGLGLGGLWGAYNTISGRGEIYFDSISALVFALLVGRYVQHRQQRYAGDALELLFSLTPTAARRCSPLGAPGDEPIEVPIEAIVLDDIVEVRAGDSVPVDGIIVSGGSQVDVSLLSGESRPVRVEIGSDVAAGSVNLTSAIRVKVSATGENTRIGKLMRTVEEAARRRAPIVKLADRLGAILLWVLLALAAVTAATWWHLGPAVAIERAVALLIVTCPCGLGLATPMAMTVAVGRAARRGMLIKGADALQALADAERGPATIMLDKTGTITCNRVSLVRWIGDPRARGPLALLESQSSHPIARAIAADPAAKDALRMSVEDVHQVVGAGIRGVVNGRAVTAGTAAFLESRRITIESVMHDSARTLVDEGLTPVYVATDARCEAVVGLGDPIRPDARAAIDTLRARGWRVGILSGDHPNLVSAVGRSLGFALSDIHGGVSPEDKLRIIQSLAARGPVVMVGDGGNDSAALAAATVGIAVHGGAEASLAAADIYLSREGLSPIVELIDGSSAIMRTVRRTIVVSLAYNFVAAALCVGGLINALLAAIIMPSSSLTVVAMCLGSGAFKNSARTSRAPALPFGFEPLKVGDKAA